MTALPGINCAPFDSAADLAHTGARFVRCVYRQGPQWDLRPWVQELKSYGIECLFVGDSSPNSLTTVEKNWRTVMVDARDKLGDIVKLWSWGNEPDNGDPNSIASWKMSSPQVNRLLTLAREVFPREAYTLVSPGLVSGQANWLDSINYWLCDLLDCHAYAKGCQTPQERAELDFMLQSYRNKGLPIMVGEYDSRTPGLSAYFRDHPHVERAAVMCWSSGQTEQEGLNLGLLQNPGAMADFVAAAGGPVLVAQPQPTKPVENMPESMPPLAPTWDQSRTYVGPGMTEILVRAGEKPLQGEAYFSDSMSVTPTESALYIWLNQVGGAKRIPWEDVG